MVGQVEGGVLVGDGAVGDRQTVIFNRIGDGHIGIAGEALVTIGAVEGECKAVCTVLRLLPQPPAPAVGAGVKVVAALVGGELDFLAIQQKACALHPVGVATDGRAKEGAVALVAPDVVTAQAHIHAVHKEGHQGCTVVGDLRPEPSVFNGVQPGFPTVGKITKGFFHVFQSPFNSEESVAFSFVIILWIGTNSNSILHFRCIFQRFPHTVGAGENCTKSGTLYPVISTCIVAQDIV